MVVAQPRCVENAFIVHPRGDVPQDEVGDRTALGVARTNGAPVVLAAVEAGRIGPLPLPGDARPAGRARWSGREPRLRGPRSGRVRERERLCASILPLTSLLPRSP